MIPLTAPGLLRAFADAGVLDASDVHVARGLGKLGGEERDAVLLAAALAVRSLRAGSVCVELATVRETVLVADAEDDEEVAEVDVAELPWPADWEALADSPIVAVGKDAAWQPLRLVDGLLYLDRYWQQEQAVRRALEERAARPMPPVDLSALPDLFGDERGDRQRLAAAVAAGRWLSVITGGPGTGKTHTVARLLKLLRDHGDPPARIALAAPTGKAAARLQEAVQEQAAKIGLPLDLTASTLHRLLGSKPGSRSRFRHDAGNQLPYDVVVVDETSMVSLTMMARLMEAVRPTARLILVGDPDQLSPVEAGAVLNDLVHRPPEDGPVPALGLDEFGLDETELGQLRNGVTRLVRPHRFGQEIGDLGDAIREGDADRTLELLGAGGVLSLHESAEAVREEVVDLGHRLAAAARAGRVGEALGLLGQHRLLCAHRHGDYGVSRWNDVVAAWTGVRGWEPGTPFLVTANDYENHVFNGDAGVVVSTPDGPQAAFATTGEPRCVSLARLSDLQVAHALTVHRGQGSQYDVVTVLLPTESSAILSRELLYTAVTRARAAVRVVGTEDAVRAAVGRPSLRASGLRRRL